MFLQLKILHGSLRDRRGKIAGYEIHVRKQRFLIGTAADCDLRCPSLVISPRHCAIERDPDRIVVRDLGSRRGTYVNGHRIDGSACLFHGDRLRVGRLEFEVIALAGSSPTRVKKRKPRRLERAGIGRDTIHEATDTVVGLVSHVVAAARRTQPAAVASSEHLPSIRAGLVRTGSRESEPLPQS